MKTGKITGSLYGTLRTTVYVLAFIAVCLMTSFDPGFAAEAQKAMTAGEVGDALKRDFPDAQYTKIDESGIAGVYEVTVGRNVIYYAPAPGRIIVGEIHDKSGLNITAEKRKMLAALYEAETAKLLDTLPLDRAVKVGNGKNIVIEFTDPDCVYCRKIEEFFTKRDDITRYVFFFPLEQIHPQAKAKSKEILCAQDPAAAYKSAMDGALDKAVLKGCGSREKEIDDILALHIASAMKMGVSGTPAMWVNKRQVSGADAKKLEKFLSEGPTGSGAADGLTVK